MRLTPFRLRLAAYEYRLWQRGPRTAAYDGSVAAVEEAIGVHIGTEVGDGSGLTGTIARLQRVAGIDEAVTIGVAHKYAHRHANVSSARAIIYT